MSTNALRVERQCTPKTANPLNYGLNGPAIEANQR